MGTKSKDQDTIAEPPADFNFERALEQLERLVSAMEQGELSLEESLRAFEQGIKLTRECQAALNRAEQKVQVLVNEAGDTEAFEADPNQD